MFDLISIGDARIDNFLRIEDAHVACTLNKERCELCFNYGDKIPVQEFHSLVAGNNANNAVGAVRLKVKPVLYCNVGDDVNGRRIIDQLQAEGVDTRYIKVNEGLETEVSTVINFKGERTILVYHQPWHYSLPDFDKLGWVYFSSVSYSFAKTDLVRQIENYLERTGVNLVYTPGTYQLRHGVKKFPKLLSLAAIFIVNLEEAKRVLGIDEGKKVEIKKLLSSLLDLGPKMVVITDGKEGSYAYDGQQYYKMGIFPARLVEMTGSGDAYATGLMVAMMYGQDLPAAMRWGAANGAAVVEQIGPQAGLLSYDEMQKRLRENAQIIARQI